MANALLIKNALIINEGKIVEGAVFIFNEKIHKIFTTHQHIEIDQLKSRYASFQTIDAEGIVTRQRY